MALRPPDRNKPALGAWRRGFWDQREGRARKQYRGRGHWMQRFYQQGWHEAEGAPGVWDEACFTDEALMISALRFAIRHAGATVPETGERRAIMDAIQPGWERLLGRTESKQKEKRQ